MEGLRGADTQGNELLLQEEGRTGAGRSETTEAASAGKQRDGIISPFLLLLVSRRAWLPG